MKINTNNNNVSLIQLCSRMRYDVCDSVFQILPQLPTLMAAVQCYSLLSSTLLWVEYYIADKLYVL